MANKKFHRIKGAVELPELAADFENSVRFESVWVGDLGVYYKSGFRTIFISYEEMERAFIRIQEVNGKLCCGKATFAYNRLVFVVKGKEYAEAMTEHETAFDEALELISKKAPSLPIGFVGKEVLA